MVVALRAVEDADLPLFFEHQLDPLAVEMARFPARDRQEFAEIWARIRTDPRAIQRTILADGQVAGNLMCWGPPGERNVGYWLGRAFWRRGIASEALRLFLRELEERPLYARVAKTNLASRRVLEKRGFLAIPGDREDEEEILFVLL